MSINRGGYDPDLDFIILQFYDLVYTITKILFVTSFFHIYNKFGKNDNLFIFKNGYKSFTFKVLINLINYNNLYI